jgi:tetratricopeptide (TPR) repeat protein
MENLKTGQILLSRFSLVEMLGEGGMGQVWAVWDLELELQIAIKVLNPHLTADSNRVKLLKNECRNTRHLVHPNIVRVFDFHRAKDLAFISMEYIEGDDLDTLRRRLDTFSYPDLVDLLQPVIDALSYAHDLGLVHRDVKAGNILVDRKSTPYLTDFGIAGVFKSGSNALRITSGGSLYCMSPQQLDGQEPSPADDTYALGVLMYELLTGYPPFYPDITSEKVHNETPTPVNQKLQQLTPGILIPNALEDMISQMLAKDPQERPAGMQEVRKKLKDLSDSATKQTMPPHMTVSTAEVEKPSWDEPDIIAPVEVPGEGLRIGKQIPVRRNWYPAVALTFVFVCMLAGGAWLLHYLTKNPATTTKFEETRVEREIEVKGEPAAEPTDQPPAIVDPAKQAVEKGKAEEELADFMRAKNELDQKGASEWGGPQYAEMIQLSQEADALLLQKDFVTASKKYAAAIAKAKLLADQTEKALQRLLEEGHIALDEGNGQQAQQKFRVALMIDPQNQAAQHSLERAKKIDKVIQHIESGKRYEQQNNLSFAHADYQEALKLDPESNEARAGLRRVKGQIIGEEFQQLMSEGLAALHNNDYTLARTKLMKAKSFRPDSSEVQDALAQVDQAIRLARIEKLRESALEAETSENWKGALKSYLAVLKIDENIQFANQGKERSVKHIQVAKRLNFFLQNPTVLESDSQLNNAVQLVNEIAEIDPKGPQLIARYEKLQQLVTAAQTPVKLTIESDNLTEVAVYKVGKLGRFEIQELSLRPGTYTVVGARSGYKDVRQNIVIKPGQGSLRITIICKVKI